MKWMILMTQKWEDEVIPKQLRTLSSEVVVSKMQNEEVAMQYWSAY